MTEQPHNVERGAWSVENTTDKINFIRAHDPDGAARLERLLAKKETLQDRNIYGDKFTGRQFSLVFTPLMDTAFERAQILEALSKGDDTVHGLSEKLGFPKDRVFTHIKELMRKNLVEIAGHKERDALFRKM
jgi:hypothetical protein